MKQALCAEAIGTLFLVMTVVGSGIMADQLSGGIDGFTPDRQHACDRRHFGDANYHFCPSLGRISTRLSLLHSV